MYISFDDQQIKDLIEVITYVTTPRSISSKDVKTRVKVRDQATRLLVAIQKAQIPEDDVLEPMYRRYAQEVYQEDGELEFDNDAIVSISGDGGAYVQGWKWVDSDAL